MDVVDTTTRECGPALGSLLREMASYVFTDHEVQQLGSGECAPRDGWRSAMWINLGDGTDHIGRVVINRKGDSLANMRHRVTMERYTPITSEEEV